MDKLEKRLRRRFGAKGGNRIVSAVSKVAAFVRPTRFVACDSYAKKGLNIVLQRATSCSFDTHACYLAMFDEAWAGEQGQEIRAYMKDSAHSEVEHEPRFQRRVLDVCLMMRGGRWAKK